MLFLAAYFVRSKNHHAGSFVAKESIVTAYLSSPAFCRRSKHSNKVHILHDVTLTQNYKSFPFARFFQVHSNSSITSNEFRFLVFLNHLVVWARLHQHIYLTDLADVTVLLRPLPRAELAVASDVQGARRWLWSKGQLIGFSKEDTYMQALRNGSAFMYNCGIIGGPSGVLRAFLKALVDQLVRFWSTREVQTTCYGADMFFVNRLLFDMRPPLTGHPRGPVNLPMWAVVPGCGSHACRHRFLNQTMDTYWFGHKIPPTWTAVFRDRYCSTR